MTQLPDKRSALIKLALEDLEKCEQDPRYVIDMNYWHTGSVDVFHQPCRVCLAGVVMAKSLNFPPTHTMGGMFKDFDYKTRLQFRALNCLREGLQQASAEIWVMAGFVVNKPQTPEHIPITPYEQNPKQFKANMLRLANALEAIGE